MAESTESKFLAFMGDSPQMRILDFLITGREFDYSLSDIAEGAGVSWSTLHRIFPAMERSGIAAKTREVGRAKLYRLSTQKPEVAMLVSLYDSLAKKTLQTAREIHGREKQKQFAFAR
ncbi:MAG: winged helix-turn-helix domain-containing protein [Candidatus Diapherotrites archaeon]